MKNSKPQVLLDPQQRSAILSGVRLPLQDKAWQVLAILIQRAPRVVCRQALIEEVWCGHYVTGEKGLNQALWAIRTALGDNARAPTYIRTLARKGYQWLPATNAYRRPLYTQTFPRVIAASILMLLSGALSISAGNAQTYDLPSRCLGAAGQQTSAFLANRNVIVAIRGGCQLIVKPSGTKTFGAPLVSSDGEHVAFTVQRDSGCEFVSIALRNGRRTEFGVCPSDPGS